MTMNPASRQPRYLHHFNLRCSPFQLVPAVDCFFSGRNRRDLLDDLANALAMGDQLVLLSGPLGSGKTTLARMLISRLAGRYRFIHIANARIDLAGLHEAVTRTLGLPCLGPGPEMVEAVGRRVLDLRASGTPAVLLVDDAQDMHAEALHEIGCLARTEREFAPQLQVVLTGTEDLDIALAKPEMRALRDQIVQRLEVSALDERESLEYLAFRIRNAGGSVQIVAPDALELMASSAHGLVRQMNVLADQAFEAACCEHAPQVLIRHVYAALATVAFEFERYPVRRSLRQSVKAWNAGRLPAAERVH